jgi:hypothetical protein
MARTWVGITVELLGGRGEELWPLPGRVFAVGPSHTFDDLADAINTAFARWDRAHVSLFTLADGRVVADLDTGASLTASGGGPLIAALNITSTKVMRTVRLGEEFQFTFDLGDSWTHRCIVEDAKIDPVEELGIHPDKPLPYWGWGQIPDQHGRRWADDDGSGPTPPAPSRPHPMVTGEWPALEQMPILNPAELRVAAATGDAARFLAAVAGRDIDEALQHIALGLPWALAQGAEGIEEITLSVINRLIWRSRPGDQVAADDLLALLRREPLPGRATPVDLDVLLLVLDSGDMADGCYLDLETGQLQLDSESDDAMATAFVNGEEISDPDDHPERYLWLAPTKSREAWLDMSAFAEHQRDDRLRGRLERAIEGAGAFRRFRDAIYDADLGEQWSFFSEERQLGRVRDLLAEHGVRISAPRKAN